MEIYVLWTPEMVTALYELNDGKRSASQIALILAERFDRPMTRNAVIGRCHRSGISLGAARARKNAASDRQSQPPRRNIVRIEDRRQLELLPITAPLQAFVEAETIALPISNRVSLFDLTPQSCRFPLGDPSNEDFGFCGADRGDTRPYCPEHMRLAYVPRRAA